MDKPANDNLMLIQTSLDHMGESIVIFDHELKFAFWNQAFIKLMDYPKRLLKVGMPLKDLISFNLSRGVYGQGAPENFVQTRLDQISQRKRETYSRAMPDGRIVESKWYPLPDGGMVVVSRDITAQRRTEDTLRRQAEIIQGMHEAIFVHDQAGLITGWNRAAERLWGYTREEVLGKHRGLLLASEAGSPADLEINEKIKAKGRFEGERNCARKNSKEFIASVTVSLLEEEQIGPPRFVCFVRDITAQKRAEAEAVSMQQRFEAFMANSPVVAFIKDAEGRHIFANKIFESALSPERRDWLGKRDAELWDDETAQKLQDHDAKVLATGKPVVIEERVETDEGLRTYLVSKFPIESETGERMLGGLALDLTGIKKTEQALRESEARLRGVHENAADGIFTMDERGILETTNQAAEEMFGYSGGELVGKDVTTLMGGDHKTQHQVYVDKYVQTGRGQILGVGPRELTGIRKDGSELALDLAVNVMNMDDRRIFVGVIRDITDRKETRRQLQQAQKMEAIGQLTGGIAHDFNNMLAVVLGNLELAVERIGEGGDIKKLLDLALEGATRGADLTKRLLAFSRQQFLEPRSVDVNEAIAGMADILHRTIAESVGIDINRGSNLWNVTIDPIQLQSAVLNLAINARDAMPEGGRLQIKTYNANIKAGDNANREGLKPGEYVVISVKDSGIGISAEDMEHIFEPFFTTKDIGKGSGLGLSMVHGFAEQSGGKAIAVSEPGQGAEIFIYLPRSRELETSHFVSPGKEKIGAREIHVLLVEDDQEVRVLVSQYLKAMKFQVIEAKNGANVEDILGGKPQIDLLLTDMVLPGGMGGPEIARLVRKHIPDVRMLYMSGYAAHSRLHGETIEESARLIQKPFRRRDLESAITEVLSL